MLSTSTVSAGFTVYSVRAGVVVLALTALVTAACGREAPAVTQSGPSESSATVNPVGGTADRTATMNPVVPTESDDPTNRTPAAATPSQRVELQEYQIRMESSLPAGPRKLALVNSGKEDHAFEIEGNGVHVASQVLKRGDAAEVTVDLKPGTYTVYCPVKDHKAKGMKMTLTVP